MIIFIIIKFKFNRSRIFLPRILLPFLMLTLIALKYVQYVCTKSTHSARKYVVYVCSKKKAINDRGVEW